MVQIDLVGDDDLGFLGQRLAVLTQLISNAVIVIHRIGSVHRCNVQHMGQQGRPLDMFEELKSQARIYAESGDISQEEMKRLEILRKELALPKEDLARVEAMFAP